MLGKCVAALRGTFLRRVSREARFYCLEENMLYEKKKILIHRIVWGILLAIGILVPVILAFRHADYYDYFAWYFAFYFFDIFVLAFFICALFLSYKAYDYEGKTIIVYAGFYHHYLKVDGEIMDEHNTLTSFTAIPLSCTLDDGVVLHATITMTNRISLKINDRLYKNYKKGI